MKNYRKILVISGIVVAFISLMILNRIGSEKDISGLYADAKEGTFKVTVTATGELIPENSIDILGPQLPGRNDRRRGRRSRMRSAPLEILDMVPEGTIVQKGDYVAQLDRTNYENTLKDETDNLDDLNVQLHTLLLDTAVVLTNLRDAIKNQVFAVEEAQINLDMSKYEPPATIRRNKIELDKQQRDLIQQKRQYNLRIAQEDKSVSNLKRKIEDQERTIEDLNTYLEGFTVTAPASGMIIYKKNRDGTKRKIGSTIDPFDMVVATLPDLSKMISKVYISELDVRKIKNGQPVNIKVDAFPDKVFTGKVKDIARIGEKLPNSDTKMFEVQCLIDGYDTRLRPTMTTYNEIIIKSIDNAVFIPLECVHAEADSIPFVYTKDKIKQIVVLGDSNEKDIVVSKGISAGTVLYTDTPPNPGAFKTEGKDLLSEAGIPAQ